MKTITAILCLSILLSFPARAEMQQAADILPIAVRAELHKPLVPMGSGIYRKFGFRAYKITFWTTDGTWDRKKPYALELHYMRDVSKDTMVDTVMDDLRDQHVADDETIERWHQILEDILSDVKDGDTIVSLCLPGQKASPLFHNENVIARIDDRAFINAFFNIWLGDQADESLRGKLLGQEQ